MIFRGATMSVILRDTRGQDFLNSQEEAFSFHNMTFLGLLSSYFFLIPIPQILQSAA